jgi:uncharacterized protein with GYD domain
MAKYLVKASYNQQGLKGLMEGGGSARVSAVEKLAAGVGGSLESLYFAFGDADVYVTIDVPGHAQAAAVAAAVGSSGAFSSYETVVLLSPEEVDEAMKAAVDYSPPGG